MFGFFKRRKENKLMSDAMEIIGKAFILDGYTADDAMQIAMVSIDLLYKHVGEVDGSAWVLAVRGMHVFQVELKKDSDDGNKKVLRSLKDNILLSMDNAKSEANEIELLILSSINDYSSLTIEE